MTFGVVSGFAPVNGSQSVATKATGQTTASQDSPVGMFEALLALVGTKVSEVTAITPAKGEIAPPPVVTNSDVQAALGALMSQAVAAKVTTEAEVQPTPAVNANKSADAPDLLAGLVDQLTALQDVIGGSTPLDPAAEKKLTETIEALAAALGIELPQAPTAEAAIAKAASATPASVATAPVPVLDPPATIEATAKPAPTPATQLAQATSTPTPAAATTAAAVAPATAQAATPAPAGGLTVSPGATVEAAPAPATPSGGEKPTAAAPVVTAGVQATTAAPEGTPAQAGVQVAPTIATQTTPEPVLPTPAPVAPDGSAAPATPVVKELADKLTQLATVLSPKMPELAKKLEALAEKLTSGEVKPDMLAKLGLDIDADADLPDTEIARAIDRLLAPRTEAKQPTAPVPFTTANLAMPDLGATATGKTAAVAETKTANAPAPAPVQVDAKPDPEPDTDTIQTAQRAPERADKIDAPPQRSSFNTTFQASLAADTSAQPANSATAPATVVVGSAVGADAKAMHAAYRAPVQQISMPQMAVEIVRQVEAGNSRFQIRLDPPELGRIDVKLDVDKAGNVNARMTVERSETLDLMQRDQRTLEKALAQAGLDSAKTNLEFSLRQNPSGREGQQQQGGDSSQPSFPSFGAADADEVPVPHITAYRGYASASGVNLFI